MIFEDLTLLPIGVKIIIENPIDFVSIPKLRANACDINKQGLSMHEQGFLK